MRAAWLLAWAVALTAAGEPFDYYAPAPSKAATHPAAILIHGGGFVSGSKKDAEQVALARLLSGAGYAVFAIDYRLSYPLALEDTRGAVRFVRINARRWSVDPKRIALVGLEAGGYLANLAGQSADVRAVVSLAALSDFRGWPVSPELRSFLAPLIAARGLEQALAEASPVMHIRPDAPPFLLIHGDADAVVPMVQSAHWQNALQAAGVPCNLILIGGGGHDVQSWGSRDWAYEMIGWLDRAMKR
jgi:acetyl esterase/lipase